MKPRVLLIDLSAVFHPAWRANENGPVSVAYEGTIGGVRRCISNAGEAALVAVCLDSKKNWRKEISPSYKAHREALPPVFYAEFDRVKQRLRDDGLLLLEAEGFEADDVMATANRAAIDAGHTVRVASHDKDLLQIVGPMTDYLSLSSFNVGTEATVREKYGIEPSQIGDWLALVGDKSDGVKGAPGIGDVRATKLLQAYGNLAGVFKAAYDLQSDMTPAIRKSLTENGDGIELARKLVTLRTDTPIKFEEIWETREVKPLVTVEEDMPHDLGSIQEEIEDRATEVHKDVGGLGGGALLGAIQEDPQAGKSLDVATQAGQSTELVTVEYSKQLEPRSFRDVLTFAKYAFNSRLYQKFTSPDAIAMVVVRGPRAGLRRGRRRWRSSTSSRGARTRLGLPCRGGGAERPRL